MKLFSHSFLATQLLILLPKIQSGIVSRQTPTKQAPRTQKTCRVPSLASQELTK
jgi:hypothetical protein